MTPKSIISALAVVASTMAGCAGNDLDAQQTPGPENTGDTRQAFGHDLGHGHGYGDGSGYGHGYGDGSGYGELGGLHLIEYCRSLEGPDARSILVGGCVNDWRCVVHGDSFPIDMQEACRAEYGGYRVRAQYGDFNDPYSWLCYAG
jgi:hypothetical protein